MIEKNSKRIYERIWVCVSLGTVLLALAGQLTAQTPSTAADPKLTRTTATATKVPPKPGILSTPEKLLAVQRTLSTKGKKANSLNGAISLSPSRPWISNGASLSFDKSVRLSGGSSGGYAEFQQQPNYVALYFTPPVAGLYLFDVMIEATAKSKVLLFSYGGQGFSSVVTQSKPGHQLFIFDIQKTDHPTEFILTSDAYRWYFYNLEISQIK